MYVVWNNVKVGSTCQTYVQMNDRALPRASDSLHQLLIIPKCILVDPSLDQATLFVLLSKMDRSHHRNSDLSAATQPHMQQSAMMHCVLRQFSLIANNNTSWLMPQRWLCPSFASDDTRDIIWLTLFLSVFSGIQHVYFENWEPSILSRS